MDVQYGSTGDAVDEIKQREWVAQCARRLRQHWRTIDLASLEEVAAELYGDERMRSLSPSAAAVTWLGQGVCVSEPPRRV
jgi:hypothetical protein